MKTAQQIIGLPVVSIFDGNEIGKVKNVIINASKGTIDFLLLTVVSGRFQEALFLQTGFWE